MLESLSIHNLTLFEEITLEFRAGLNVLTGETGAGKSLVVDAMNFLCGDKADRDMIRYGSSKAYVEGSFDISNSAQVRQLLTEQEMDAEDSRLMLSRELNISGRSVFRINGIAVSQAAYREISAQLIDIHGQHEHQSLLLASSHLRYLDLFGDARHLGLLTETTAKFKDYMEYKKQVQQAEEKSRTSRDRLETLTKQKKELDGALLQPGEEEQLQQSKELLRNADKIDRALNEAGELLFDHPGTEKTALSLLFEGIRALDVISGMDEHFHQLSQRLNSMYYELEELGHDAMKLRKGIQADSGKLEEIESRLDFLMRLSRKYGVDTEEMLQTLSQINQEIQLFELMDENLESLHVNLAQASRGYFDSAASLSASRKTLAKRFENQIETLLSQLNMSGTRFHTAIASNPDAPRAEGIDQITMLIAPNIGEEMKPLSKIASGGELSRLMLAMKAMSAEKNEVPTMVFDEIDTGVSGKTAQVIAEKLWDIARFRQVICVTHLHQLAAMANEQYHVTKTESQDRTMTKVSLLDHEERINEIAKMLGDLKTQEKSSRQHAEVLLHDAARYREENPLIT